MLYAFDVTGKKLDPLTLIEPGAAGVKENDIEKAIADRPTSIFRREANELPLLIVKKSVQGARMADIIALDAEGRLVLVECKRGWATRETLAQLLDYASEYHPWRQSSKSAALQSRKARPRQSEGQAFLRTVSAAHWPEPEQGRAGVHAELRAWLFRERSARPAVAVELTEGAEPTSWNRCSRSEQSRATPRSP